MNPEPKSEDYYYLKQEYGEKFFKLPKVFFTSSRYKKTLSGETKTAYAILSDRKKVSVKNHWIDSEGKIYFEYTNEELAGILDCCKQTINKIKKELKKTALLYQKRMGMNQPNRLYLLRPKVSVNDVYILSGAKTRVSSGSLKNRLPKKPGNIGSLKNRLPGISTKLVDKTRISSGSLKNRHKLDKDLNTRYNKDTAKPEFLNKDFSQTQIKEQNQLLVNKAKDFKNRSGLSKQSIYAISRFVNAPNQIYQFIGIILNAKKDINQKYKAKLHLGNDNGLDRLITHAIWHFFNCLKTHQNKKNKIKSPKNYLYKTFYNLFQKYINGNLKNSDRTFKKENIFQIGKDKQLVKTSNQTAQQIFSNYIKESQTGK